MIGAQLGHYRILGKLGAGGMGEVYRAHDERLDRDVALKVLPEDRLEDADARARLLREARAAAALNHPAICTIHEVGHTAGQAYIAMELLDGRPLSERVDGRALPSNDVVGHGLQIADALAHAHARQVVHRDLKSGNIIVGPDGRVKVLDFGLAKRLAGSVLAEATTDVAPATLTKPGVLVGTLAYMAPEQLRGEPADARSDLWALGVVLYEMAVGHRPFEGQSGLEVSSKILIQPPAPYPSTVPVSLRVVIDRCLEKHAGRRYQSASEVRAALEAIQAGAPTVRAALWYRLTRRPWLTAAAAVLVLVAAAAVLNLDWMGARWAGGAPRIQSLAVLPLENLSGDSAQDYFADGMTEVLSTDLARLSALKRVTARSSVIRLRGTRTPLADIARELNVDALVTGSVLRSGNRVSITAQLLDPATGDQLWTNRYERDLQDVLQLRNEIVSAIVREINAQLSVEEQAQLASTAPVNPQAFEAYLKGRFEWAKQTREGFDQAERYFQSAVEIDSGYALAYAGLASVWFMRGDTGFLPPIETFPKAAAFMQQAMALGQDVADLHVHLANHKAVTEWDWAGAEREHRRAIALNANHADAHFFLAHVLTVLKRTDEGSREMDRSLELDPLNDFNRSFYGWHLNYLRRYDEAIAVFQKLLPAGPNRASNYLGLWGAYHRKGQYEEALGAAREYFVATGDRDFADVLGTGREASVYRAAMTRAGDLMVERSKSRHVPALRIARMYAHAGDADRALHWLERAYENREPALMRLGVFWDWLDLHADPRFQDLLRRLKLPA